MGCLLSVYYLPQFRHYQIENVLKIQITIYNLLAMYQENYCLFFSKILF